MLEANVLYSVTGVVVAGLVGWVAVVLKTAKEPWAREVVKAPVARTPDVPLETPEANDMTSEGDPITAEVAEETKAHAHDGDEAEKADKAD